MILSLAVGTFLLTLVNPSPSFTASKAPVFQHVEEWHMWKSNHGKSYNSHMEELEKHTVWLSNKVFIEQHNINAERGFYSYKMKLNHLADMVC